MSATWRKSSYSSGNGGQCVEVGDGNGVVLVRDTKQAHMSDGDRSVVRFSRSAWKAFTTTLK